MGENVLSDGFKFYLSQKKVGQRWKVIVTHIYFWDKAEIFIQDKIQFFLNLVW